MSVATIERPAILDKLTHTQFELCSTKKSSWLKEGTGMGTNVPEKRLSHSKILFVPMISRLFLGKGLGYRQTMYVIGANTIYIDDYYEDKDGNLVLESVKPDKAKDKGYQLRPGLKSQGYDVLNTVDKWSAEYRRSMGRPDPICFEDGRLDARKYGDDPMLIKFLNEHEQNKFAPRAPENKDPTRLKLFMFQPLIREAKAAKAKIVETFDDSLEAMNFVGRLRTKRADGYTFNEPLMDAVLNIIEDGIGLQPGDVNQKFEVIARAVRTDGKTFMDIINETMKEYKMAIATAESTEVLSYSGKDANITADGKKTAFYTCNSTVKSEMIDELTLHFLSGEKGKNDFRELQRNVEVAKIKSMNKK